MNLKDLMSGIAVVIDDKLDASSEDASINAEGSDLIVEIVSRFERQWNMLFYKASRMPPEEAWPNLLQSASFILLDWKLWPSGASQLERDGIEQNVRFLKQAKDYFVPVFIFTNESRDDVIDKLPESIYTNESSGKSFVFIQGKAELLSKDYLDRGAIEQWMRGNASVYALKTWDRVFRAARKDLFSSMYARSPDWPKVFWRAYKDDSVDPSFSLTHLINDSLRGRMRTNEFEAEILTDSGGEGPQVSREDLHALISETSFQLTSTEDEIRCGDLFKQPKGKFLLNLRPDCDCVPRNDSGPDSVDLYCIGGKRMKKSEVHTTFDNGHFRERTDESIVFAAGQGRSIRFKFKDLCVRKFGELKDQRIGRLLHPYLTRIQQRYALFLQRQGLPRIPEAAIPPKRG